MASIAASVLAINGGSSSIKFAVNRAGISGKPSLSGTLDRIDQSYDWVRDNKEDFLTFYEGFTKQDRATVESIYEEQASYVRVPVDDALAGTLQQVHDTWVEAGVLQGNLDLSTYVFREIPVVTN